jgi:hypothetical protein
MYLQALRLWIYVIHRTLDASVISLRINLGYPVFCYAQFFCWEAALELYTQIEYLHLTYKYRVFIKYYTHHSVVGTDNLTNRNKM